MGYNYYMPTGYYLGRQKKEEDKYDGLLSNKQRRDLESETELKRTGISKKELQNKVRRQQLDGVSNTFAEPNKFFGQY